jgi:hypothetical protein
MERYLKEPDSDDIILDFDEPEDFENFKSNVCHSLESAGDLRFLLAVLKSTKIQDYYNNNQLLECFYLLGMVDYLCRINNLPFSDEYDYIRKYKMKEPVFPGGIHILCSLKGNDKPKDDYLKKAIPEFLIYNIVEGNVKNVV